jgi:hypothetical protein
MTGFGDVRRWRAAPLEQAQAALKRDLDELVAADEGLESPAARVVWAGRAADVAADRRTQVRSALAALVAEVAAVRRALADAADGVTALERDVRDVLEFAASEEFRVTDAGVVVDVSAPVELPEDQVADYAARRRRTRDAIVADVEGTLRLAAAIDADLLAVLGRARRDAVTAGTPDAALARLRGASQGAVTWPPPDGRTPTENAEWWESLTASQQQQVLDDAPHLVGNLDGIPAAVRDDVNRARLPGLLEDLEADLARAQQAVEDVPLVPGAEGLRYQLLVERQEIEDKIASLEEVRATLGLSGDRQLLLLDAGGNRATAAIAHGDVDTAEHVAVFTPGFTTTVDASLATYDRDMLHLRQKVIEELDKEGRHDEGVATVTWIGYEAPQWSEVVGANSVAGQGAAERGAARLAPFLQGINASREHDPHLTALGHSYGSTTSGLALQEETGVDDYVAYGSPGLGTSDVEDLRVSGDVYYAEARRDAVGDLARFGRDPSHLDGVIQLSTSAETDPDGRPLLESVGHSEYVVEDSTSQHNIAVVVAGMPEKIIHGEEDGFGDALSRLRFW